MPVIRKPYRRLLQSSASASSGVRTNQFNPTLIGALVEPAARQTT